jgi:predicted RNA-binding protein YlqC (UPF0109 family)
VSDIPADDDADDEVDGNRIDDADLADDDEVDGNRRDEVADSAAAPGDDAAPRSDEGSAGTASGVLDYLVKALVDEPDGVEVDAIDRRGGVQLEVRVAPGDMGRVIGKRGRTAQAIRAVTRAAAVKDGVEVNIEFME